MASQRDISERYDQQPVTPYSSSVDYKKLSKELKAVQNDNTGNFQKYFQSEKKVAPLKDIWEFTKENHAEFTKGSPEIGETTKRTCFAFTLETPNLYKDFNDKSRALAEAIIKGESKTAWDAFEYKSVWFKLNNAIMQYNSTEKVTLYRGVKGFFPFKRGMIYCFGQIASTSKSRALAEKYATRGEKKYTLFIINNPRNFPIAKLSRYPNEQEHIIRAWELFEVDRTTKETGFDVVYLNSVK